MTQAEIDQAIRDQIGTDPLAPLPSNPDIAAALANSESQAARVASSLNDNLTGIYLVGFQNWASQVIGGKIPNTNPPQPPDGYLAVKATDGWSYTIRGTAPVCAVPPIPQLPQPPAPPQDSSNVRSVPLGDTLPVGFVITAPDGSRWQKQTSPTPFGTAYYYQKMAA